MEKSVDMFSDYEFKAPEPNVAYVQNSRMYGDECQADLLIVPLPQFNDHEIRRLRAEREKLEREKRHPEDHFQRGPGCQLLHTVLALPCTSRNIPPPKGTKASTKKPCQKQTRALPIEES